MNRVICPHCESIVIYDDDRLKYSSRRVFVKGQRYTVYDKYVVCPKCKDKIEIE